MEMWDVILLVLLAALLAIVYLGSAVIAMRQQRPALKRAGMMVCVGGAVVWLTLLASALDR